VITDTITSRMDVPETRTLEWLLEPEDKRPVVSVTLELASEDLYFEIVSSGSEPTLTLVSV
jgi:hypothetical protein